MNRPLFHGSCRCHKGFVAVARICLLFFFVNTVARKPACLVTGLTTRHETNVESVNTATPSKLF